MTEKEIIEGCLKGSRTHQEALYKLYYSRIFGICMRYERDDARAKDLLQSGFIKVFDKIKNYKFSGSFEAWILRIFSHSFFH